MSARPFRLSAWQPTEHSVQASFVQWCRWHERQYPELKLLFAVPNGAKRDIATAGKLKAEGLRPGVMDTVLPVARKGYHGLFLELKRPGNATWSRAQFEYKRLLEEQNYCVRLADGPDEAISIVKWYLANKGGDAS